MRRGIACSRNKGLIVFGMNHERRRHLGVTGRFAASLLPPKLEICRVDQDGEIRPDVFFIHGIQFRIGGLA